MKKILLAATISGLFAATAHAQSSVTLYGSLDAGVAYANNTRGTSGSGQTWGMGSGLVSDNVWGLKGSEDLGGGLHAIFRLENRFNLGNGQFQNSGEEFGRQAYVGLQSDQYGTVTLGKQFDSMVDYLAPLSMIGEDGGNNMAAHPLDNDNLDHSFSISNAVKYQSANYGGFRFGGLYGFSNSAGQFSQNRAWSAGASYNWGPLNAAASYLQLNSSGGGVTGVNTTGGAVSSSNEARFIAGTQRTFGGGLNYSFGPATVGFVYTHTKLDNLGSVNVDGTYQSVSANSLRLDNYEVNGKYALTPALALKASYTFTNGKLGTATGDSSPKYHTVALMADYGLSKRTDVYVEGAFQKTSGGNGSVLTAADINGFSPSSTDKQVAVTVGMRHRF